MNMNKQYRAELKQLNRAAKKINAASWREFAQIGRAIAKLQRARFRINKGYDRQLAKVNARIAVLEGRLS